MTTTLSASVFPTTSTTTNSLSADALISVNSSQGSFLAVNSSQQNHSENVSSSKKTTLNVDKVVDDSNDDAREKVLKWTIAIGLSVMLACGSAALVISRCHHPLSSDGKDCKNGPNPDAAFPVVEPEGWKDVQDIQDKVSGIIEDTDSVELVDGCGSTNVVVDIKHCLADGDDCLQLLDSDVEVEGKKGTPHSTSSCSHISLEVVSPLAAQEKDPQCEAVNLLQQVPSNDAIVPGERMGSTPTASASNHQEPATDPAEAQECMRPAQSSDITPITSAISLQLPTSSPIERGPDTGGWMALSFPSSWFPPSCQSSCTKPSVEEIHRLPRTQSMMSSNRGE